MKQQRHKREESFSILLISNVGQSSRQFHVSRLLVRVAVSMLLVIVAALIWLACLAITAGQRTQELKEQLSEQEQTAGQLEEEIETLKSEKLSLASENEELNRQLAAKDSAEENETAETLETEETDREADPAFPSRYPCSGSGIMTATYSGEQPYISIQIRADGNIIAAGDGTVSEIGSDDTYPLIVEVDHGNGYKTRYMCRSEAEIKTGEGDPVRIGEILLTTKSNDTQLDYQVICEGETIDPLTVIEAKG